MSADTDGRPPTRTGRRTTTRENVTVAGSTDSRPPRNGRSVNALAIRAETVAHRFPATGQEIRSILIDGEPWFVGKDVAEALGYANTRKAVKDHVPAGHRRGNESFPLSDLGFQPQTVLIDEAGLYRLILRANTEPAERFQEWVTAEVLPSIRRTGAYGSAPAPAAGALDSPEAILRLAESYADAARRLVGAEQRVAELAPAAEAWGVLADAKGDFSVRDASHILNRDPSISTGQGRLFQFLRDEQMIDAKLKPYARYSRYLVERPVTWQHRGTGETRLTFQVRVTADGLEYLRRRLGGIRVTT